MEFKSKVTEAISALANMMSGDCFVLTPKSDPAALEALRTYANVTDDKLLQSGLRVWIAQIEENSQL